MEFAKRMRVGASHLCRFGRAVLCNRKRSASDPYRQHRFCFTVCIDGGNSGRYTPGAAIHRTKRPDDRLFGAVWHLWAQNSGKLHMALYEQTDSDEKILIEDFAVDVSHMQDNAWQVMQLTEPLENAAGKNLLLEVSSPDGALGNAVTVYYGNSVSAGPG